MEYSKPRITIDLDEYTELKKASLLSDDRDLKCNDQLAISDGFDRGLTPSLLTVMSVTKLGDGKTQYTLRGPNTNSMTLIVKRNS